MGSSNFPTPLCQALFSVSCGVLQCCCCQPSLSLIVVDGRRPCQCQVTPVYGVPSSAEDTLRPRRCTCVCVGSVFSLYKAVNLPLMCHELPAHVSSQGVISLDFHPTAPILASGSKDCTIKFFHHSKPAVKRASWFIQVRVATHARVQVTIPPLFPCCAALPLCTLCRKWPE